MQKDKGDARLNNHTVEKQVRELDGKCKEKGPNGRRHNLGRLRTNWVQSFSDVTTLSNGHGAVKSAFDLILYLGEHVHGDFYMCVKMCGHHDAE